MGELGWYGLQIPEEYGGSGGSFFDATLFLEETARGQIPGPPTASRSSWSARSGASAPRSRSRALRPRGQGGHAGDRDVRAEAGSDVAELKTRARLENGEWVLNGSKMWCSYARKASHVLIVCRTGGRRHEDLSMIFVPATPWGLTITPIETLGGDETNEIYLDAVRVPE